MCVGLDPELSLSEEHRFVTRDASTLPPEVTARSSNAGTSSKLLIIFCGKRSYLFDKKLDLEMESLSPMTRNQVGLEQRMSYGEKQ